MKERILEILKNSNKALMVEEIDDRLNIKSIDETKEFLSLLNELEEEGEVYHSNKNKYMIFNNGPLKKGIIRMNKKGFGFVEVEGSEDIFISIDNINNAIHNDVVVVEILKRKEDGRLEGRIVRTIKRDLSTIVGEIIFKGKECMVIPDDSKLKVQLVVDTEGQNLGLVDGHKVVVKIEKLLEKNKYLCSLEKMIGHKNDPGVDILSIVYNYEIKDTFDEETIAELESIPEEVRESDKKGRRDLTGEIIFTIDGDDTKDIDDAISIDKLENGHYKLGVHIADVSYYVKEGSALDNEAMLRGTSVYLVDRVIPMLPHKLSNGICSLNPNVERLAVSCVMEIIQMTYKKVNQVIEEGIIPEGYEEYVDKLNLMNELSLIIRKEKDNRGYIDFDVKEAKILVDEKCHPTDIILRNRGRGENIIEDFMICANECVASHIYYMTLPFIYRVHEYPKEEKIRDFLSYLQTLGITVRANIKDVSPKSMQRLLYGLKKEKEYPVLSTQLLRNMQKAVYMPQNLGHYGLASKCYTHFTSPIRRYPDTTVHRLLRTYLFKNDMSPETIQKWEEKLVFIADNSSQKERESIDCERDVESMKMAEYMEDHIGEEFVGMVSGVANFGMFIQLENMVEGLVHVSEMKDFFHYDDVAQTLTGERTKMKYRLGDKVIVKVTRASKEAKTIDFEVIKKLDDNEEKEEDFIF